MNQHMPWTKKEDSIIKRWAGKKRAHEIAQLLTNRTTNATQIRAQALRISLAVSTSVSVNCGTCCKTLVREKNLVEKNKKHYCNTECYAKAARESEFTLADWKKKFKNIANVHAMREHKWSTELNVDCPQCDKPHWNSSQTMRQQISNGRVVGICRSCSNKNRFTLTFEDVKSEFPTLNILEISRKRYSLASTAVYAKMVCRRELAGDVCGAEFWREIRALRSMSEEKRVLCRTCANNRKNGHITPQGYKIVYWRAQQWMEHRLIVNNYLLQTFGHPLPADWTVHHRNGQRSDNRIENLEPRAPGNHRRGLSIADLIHNIELLGGKVQWGAKSKVFIQ